MISIIPFHLPQHVSFHLHACSQMIPGYWSVVPIMSLDLGFSNVLHDGIPAGTYLCPHPPTQEEGNTSQKLLMRLGLMCPWQNLVTHPLPGQS